MQFETVAEGTCSLVHVAWTKGKKLKLVRSGRVHFYTDFFQMNQEK